MAEPSGANKLLNRGSKKQTPAAEGDGNTKYQKPERKQGQDRAEPEKHLHVSGSVSEHRDDSQGDSKGKSATSGFSNPLIENENENQEFRVHDSDSRRPFRWAEVPICKIRSWRYKDRQAREILDDPSYQDLVARIETVGQLQDIGLRTLETPEGEIEYEEIFGFKRLNAKKELGHKTVTAKVYGVLSDVQAAILQATENSGDSPPSPMSKADNYYGYIRDNVFKNGATLAQMLGAGDPKTVNNLIRISRQMPDEIRDALDLHRLKYRALFALISLVNTGDSENPDRQAIDLVVKHADTINKAPESAVNVLNKIKAILNPEPKSPAPHVLEMDGSPVATFKRNKKGALTISVSEAFGKKLDDSEIEEVFRDLLKKVT